MVTNGPDIGGGGVLGIRSIRNSKDYSDIGKNGGIILRIEAEGGYTDSLGCLRELLRSGA